MQFSKGQTFWRPRWPISVPVTPPAGGGGGGVGWGESGWAPDLPNRFMTATAVPTVTGTTYTPATSAELTSALSSATYGDEIVLTAGQTYSGNFVLPAKSGWTPGAYILIRSSAVGSLPPLPAIGYSTNLTADQPRTYPQRDASFYGIILTPNTAPCVDTVPGSNGWYFWGIRFNCTSVSWNYGMVYAGPGMFSTTNSHDSTSLADLTSHFVFQQCCFYNDPWSSAVVKQLRIQTDYCAVLNCHFYGGLKNYGDSNAIWFMKSRGPALLRNNFICHNGENVLTGGADQPSWFQPLECDDIQVFHNRCWKDRRWFVLHPSYTPPTGGGNWGIKNVFELKFGRRWHFVGNIFDGSADQGQDGQGLALKTVNQNAGQNTAETCHITVERCLSKNVGSGVYISNLETYNGGTGIPAHDILIRDCAFLLPGDPYTGTGKGVYINHRDHDHRCLIDHITVVNKPNSGHYVDFNGGGNARLTTIKNSIFARRSVYGVWDNPTAKQGTLAMNAALGVGQWDFHHNALVAKDNTDGGAMASKYTAPAASLYFPGTDTVLGIDEITGKLLGGSPAAVGGAYASDDGKALGCDWGALDAEIAGVEIAAETGGYGE
jgi:hypothetical protein